MSASSPRQRVRGERRAPLDKTSETAVPRERRRGRGAASNPAGRFETERASVFHDGWDIEEDAPGLKTTVTPERVKTLIARNDSPDISFDRSINPYRGCEHGCVYCYARPFHAHIGLSSGLDFETKLFAKLNAAEALESDLSKPSYRPATIALGASTDAYQPIERRYRLTRRILEVLDRTNHPVGIVTKSDLILRDLDILSRMAARSLVKVYISITTLDPDLARRLEPRAPSPAKRLEAIRALSAAGITVGIMVAPIIPALNDHEIEAILNAAHAAGASEAGYVLLRLPHELEGLFQDWLKENAPDRMKRVLSLLKEIHGGKAYDAAWGRRMTGEGPYAWMVGRRFEMAKDRLRFRKERKPLRCDSFAPPPRPEKARSRRTATKEKIEQLSLF